MRQTKKKMTKHVQLLGTFVPCILFWIWITTPARYSMNERRTTSKANANVHQTNVFEISCALELEPPTQDMFVVRPFYFFRLYSESSSFQFGWCNTYLFLYGYNKIKKKNKISMTSHSLARSCELWVVNVCVFMSFDKKKWKWHKMIGGVRRIHAKSNLERNKLFFTICCAARQTRRIDNFLFCFLVSIWTWTVNWFKTTAHSAIPPLSNDAEHKERMRENDGRERERERSMRDFHRLLRNLFFYYNFFGWIWFRMQIQIHTIVSNFGEFFYQIGIYSMLINKNEIMKMLAAGERL